MKEEATDELVEVDQIESVIQNILEDFVKVSPRNHYFSLYAFDLYGLLRYKPSVSVWRKLLADNQELDNETEGWLFKHIIDYVLKDSDLIYTTMIPPFIESIRNSLRISRGYTVNDVTPDMIREVTAYITDISGRLNDITHNIIKNSKDMSYGVLDGESGYLLGINKYEHANEYFENEDEPLHYVHSVTTKFKDDGFRGLLIVWLLRKA